METVFISEQITEYMFEAFLENSDKVKYFEPYDFECWLNILENSINILYDFEKQWLGSFAFGLGRGMTLLKMGKKHEDKDFHLAVRGGICWMKWLKMG